MEWVVCWMVLHSSNNALDNRQYKQVSGYIMRGTTNGDRFTVNFHDAFIQMHIDQAFNAPVQRINSNECHWEIPSNE